MNNNGCAGLLPAPSPMTTDSDPNAPLTGSTPLLNIAAVERETRIAKDTLRVWERRYGFPDPQRDANGERLYPLDQVARLRTVKRLLDAGHRPGRVVPLDPVALQRLDAVGEPASQRVYPNLAVAAADDALAELLALVHAHDPQSLRRLLTQRLLGQGLARFVAMTAVPLVHAIGREWSSGRMAVFEEHLASDVIDTVLRNALASSPEPGPLGRPRVLLSTLQGEHHGLGLLMAQAMFAVEGCACVSLGCQTPTRDLVEAARALRSDIVVVSASAASVPAALGQALADLRALLPVDVALWAGQPHASLQRRGVAGVDLLAEIGAIAPQLELWRQAQAVPAGAQAQAGPGAARA